MQLTWLDIILVNCYIIVSVRTTLLMKEVQNMHHLV